ncbi:hypothetical protein UFOVP462_41 [uncultured Caudovirales phage]|uniref:Uncharacterized protein n=1 Tax=uncultured Caudovirales phage TaxID=2100421 RepID=A0A6J5MEC2_9CAUD|nr:hypothetical protein UFOVP462_41 [uncultured Caudovirales phage]
MGRKSKEYEINVQNIALKAIEEYYGSVQAGFIHLLGSDEPALVKFCWEHGVGKPTDRLEMNVEQDIKTFQVIQLPDNGRDNFIEPIEPIDESIEPIA